MQLPWVIVPLLVALSGAQHFDEPPVFRGRMSSRQPVSASVLGGATSISDCNVLVLGGSAASLSAALSAAKSRQWIVCLTDPTDWPGGQLTASAVSAIDYGKQNNPDQFPYNLPSSFVALSNLFSTNTGRCWVSYRCYQPTLLNRWIAAQIKAVPNLRLYPNTVVSNVTVVNGRVSSVTCVQRVPRSGTTGWEQPLSKVLGDFYSPEPSVNFDKRVLVFSALEQIPVIEATEFSDLLVLTSTAAQGIETPSEDSDSYLETCGQSFTTDFYVTAQTSSECDYSPPLGSPTTFSNDGFTAEKIWSYRRVLAQQWAYAPGQVNGLLQWH
jgi:hypothetical protein